VKQWLTVVALLGGAIQTHAENNASGMMFYRYCMAAADIVGGERKPPTADSMREQLEQASPCFAAVAALMEFEPLFAPEFAMCPPAGTKVSNAQVHLVEAARRQAGRPYRMGEDQLVSAVGYEVAGNLRTWSSQSPARPATLGQLIRLPA
jgi:hypothetical protein